ncbi:MAG TPA: glycosyltransferase [Gemmatimonadales bacterium]|nr:glycosyltransferase [Gemmatimonadales bacterium]
MRVVFLTHNFPRFAGDVSGAFLATLAGALTARGHGVTVIAPADGGEIGAPLLGGIAVRRVRYAMARHETLAYRGSMAETARTPGGAWRALSLVRALRRAARAEVARGADLIHAHWWVPAGLAAPSSVPLVVTVHGTDAALLGRSSLARGLARPLFRRATVVTAVSRSAADQIARATGTVVGARHIQPMPVDTSLFEPAEVGQQGRGSAGGGGLVVVARLTQQKRVDLALEAVALLPEVRPFLTIIGDGPERHPLEALRDRLGLRDAVRFLGSVPPPRVAEVLRTADLAVFPARNEGFGLGAAEALMAGVPVVACQDGGGVLEVVPAGGAGRQVPPRADAMAEAITALLADPAARVSAEEEGQRWRERLRPERVAEICEGWYHEALSA